MVDHPNIESTFAENGFKDFKWISGSDISVSQWPRFKCMFGCPTYGERGSCPPAIPSVAECRELFSEYETVAVIRIHKKLDKPEDRNEWARATNLSLSKLERAVFLMGHHKTFLLFMDECRICLECPGIRVECKNKKLSRPCPEALGVDVFATVRRLGYPIEVLTDFDQEMNRYAFLLVE